jgi:hypothetical protein
MLSRVILQPTRCCEEGLKGEFSQAITDIRVSWFVKLNAMWMVHVESTGINNILVFPLCRFISAESFFFSEGCLLGFQQKNSSGFPKNSFLFNNHFFAIILKKCLLFFQGLPPAVHALRDHIPTYQVWALAFILKSILSQFYGMATVSRQQLRWFKVFPQYLLCSHDRILQCTNITSR